MKLSYSVIKSSEPRNKPYKLFDGGGLYLEIKPSGGKYWKLKYRFSGKERKLSIGTFPDTSLKEAREERYQAKKLMAEQIDPSLHKQKLKRQHMESSQNTFRSVAETWLCLKKDSWTDRYYKNVKNRLAQNVYPILGNTPMASISIPDVLFVLRQIEQRNAFEMAHRVKQICNKIFLFAIQTGISKSNPCSNLNGALKTHQKKHLAALEFDELPELLKKLNTNQSRLFPQTIRAIWMSLFTFVRPGELRHCRWCDVDFKKSEWRVPAEFMKMRKDHIVHLAAQSIRILQIQRECTKHLNTDWVFPSQREPRKPMSDGTVNMALRRMGFKGRMTAHGFRALARTSIREQLDYAPDIIEAQLAHRPSGPLGGAYDRSKFLSRRKTMMQEWADLIQQLKI